MSVIEFFAVLTSVIYVILAAKQKLSCWYFAMASVLLYLYICFEAHLFAETGLQIFYIGTTIYGWYHWKYGNQEAEDAVPVIDWGVKEHLFTLSAGAVLVYLIGSYLETHTSAFLPYVDSFTSVFGVIATVMGTRKILSNWLYWTVIDGISVYMYAIKGLELTSGLFVFYTIMTIYGFISWRKEYLKSKAESAEKVSVGLS